MIRKLRFLTNEASSCYAITKHRAGEGNDTNLDRDCNSIILTSLSRTKCPMIQTEIRQHSRLYPSCRRLSQRGGSSSCRRST